MSEKSFCVYISCVGENDPIGRENEEGSLLTCLRYLIQIKQIQFNAVYLIPSSKEISPDRNTECRAVECREKIRNEFRIEAQIKPMKAQPAELKQVYPALRDLLTEIRKDVEQNAQGQSITFHINVSSGTTQMKESLPFLVSIGILKPHEVYLWQVFDPRHYPDLERRVQRAPELDLFAQERILLRLEQLAEQHLYQEANGWLQCGLTVKYLDFAKQLYKVLAEHDRWLYKAACNNLQRTLSRSQVPDFLQDWLQKVLNWLQKLAQKQPPKNILAIDRYYCAVRRCENSLYPDAVNHFWAACELALEEHGKNIQVYRPQDLISASELIERIRNSQSLLNRNSVKLQGQEEKTLLDAVDWLRGIRNEIAHGSRPVDKQLTKNASLIAEELFRALGWEQEMQNCPLRPKLVQEKLLQLIQAMRDSLWQ